MIFKKQNDIVHIPHDLIDSDVSDSDLTDTNLTVNDSNRMRIDDILR